MPKRKRKTRTKVKLRSKNDRGRKSRDDVDQALQGKSGRLRAQPIGGMMILKSLTIVASTSLSLVVFTWWVGGRSTAERAATDLVMPIAVAWQMLLAGGLVCLFAGRRAAGASLILGWLLVGISFNSKLAHVLMRKIEYPMADAPAVLCDPPVDAVVVLGGCTSINRFDTDELATDGQRLMQAAQLWHAGKTATIICTGTSPLGDDDPGPVGKRLLQSVGVPDDVIFISPGENTLGEMKGLRTFFESPSAAWKSKLIRDRSATTVGVVDGVATDDLRLALSTSAFHMPRALRLAQTQQLSFIPLPCSFRSHLPKPLTGRDLIPNTSAGGQIAIAIKETLASLVGR